MFTESQAPPHGLSPGQGPSPAQGPTLLLLAVFLHSSKNQFSSWKSGDLEIRKFGVQQIKKRKSSKFKSVLPKMSAKSGLVGKKSSWPHLGPSGPIFCVGRKNRKNVKQIAYFCYFTGLGPLLLSTRGGAIGITNLRDPLPLVQSLRT